MQYFAACKISYQGISETLTTISYTHQPSFKAICGIGGCLQSYTNIKTYTNHVYGVHDLSTNLRSESSDSYRGDSTTTCNNDRNLDPMECNTEDVNSLDNDYIMKTLVHNYLIICNYKDHLLYCCLGLKEKYKLPQSTVQGTAHGINSLLQQ